MSRTSISSARARSRGFTLMEAMVSLVILIIVMTVTMTLLFSMRAFAERQANHLAPRQAARQATDYMTHFLNAAGDLVREAANPNPNALVIYYDKGATPVQASYNNLTNAQSAFGDPGTDIITIAYVSNPASIEIWDTPNPIGDPTKSSMYLKFRGGCGGTNDDAANMAAFKTLTGAMTSGTSTTSGLLLVKDEAGHWQYLEITDYTSSNCADPNDQTVRVSFKPSTDATRYNPPGGAELTFQPKPGYVIAGIEYTCFRVRNRVLEQKVGGLDAGGHYPGLFDPATDNPGTRFTPLVENVEDLQVAFLFRNHPTEWWNSSQFDTATPPNWSAQTLTTPAGVPLQQHTPAATDYDSAFVSGIRLTITGRSNALEISSRKLAAGSAGQGPQQGGTGNSAGFKRPFAEDHAEGSADTLGTGIFERYRMTTTIMFRNRILGG